MARMKAALVLVGMVGAATFAVSQSEEGGVVEEASPETSEEAAPAATDAAPDVGTPETAPETTGEAPVEPEPADQGSPLGSFFTELSSSTLAKKAEESYAADVRFEDPFGRYEGRDATVEHLKKVLEGAKTAQFDIKEEFVSGDETVALWTLKLEHEDLNDGDAITVDGVTHYRSAAGKIAYQRDHYDLGAVVYENVWLLGSIVKWVKGKGA